MKTSQKKADEAVLKELAQAYGDEAKARKLLESWRWPNGPIYPHCHNASEKRISTLDAQGTTQSSVREGVFFCGACRRQFTVTVGTVLGVPTFRFPSGCWTCPCCVRPRNLSVPTRFTG